MVEDEAGPAPAKPKRGEKEEIRRAAGVHQIKGPFPAEATGEAADAPQSGEVLEHVLERAIAGASRLVAMDRDAVDLGEVIAIAILAGGTDDGHLVAGPHERG